MRILGWTSRSRCAVDRAIITYVVSDKCDTSWTHRHFALMVAFVLGRIDYCNSLYAELYADCFAGTSTSAEHSCKLLTGSGRLESAVPLMRELHWLPVSYDTSLMYDCRVWLPRGFVSSVWRYATAIGFAVTTSFHSVDFP